jgi:hypothetical protein
MTITLNKSRIFSSVLAGIYIVGGFATAGGEGGFKVLAMVILPLACIWFGDAMGGFTGPAGSIGITSPSPGLFVCIAGWILLLLPVFFIIF